jgi:hypothetical protein
MGRILSFAGANYEKLVTHKTFNQFRAIKN